VSGDTEGIAGRTRRCQGATWLIHTYADWKRTKRLPDLCHRGLPWKRTQSTTSTNPIFPDSSPVDQIHVYPIGYAVVPLQAPLAVVDIAKEAGGYDPLANTRYQQQRPAHQESVP